jgi:hypothetical protein
MVFPQKGTIPVRLLLDLSDERRDKKPWLPQNDGMDVRDGLVMLECYPLLTDAFPACREHGAMLAMTEECHVWRCGEWKCGVGAIYRRR